MAAAVQRLGGKLAGIASSECSEITRYLQQLCYYKTLYDLTEVLPVTSQSSHSHSMWGMEYGLLKHALYHNWNALVFL